jgi:hypothetical protein
MALLALVLGTRPTVTPAMVLAHLGEHFGILEDRVSVRRTRPDDFLVRFTHPEDLELVLSSPVPEGSPFVLRWRRWNRLIMGSAGAFRFRVLVGLKGIPSHARSKDTAQIILGSSCTNVEIANPEAVADQEDERELFVAAWCAHPDLVPDEKIMAVPEPEVEHDGGPPLFLRPHEIIHDEVPALRYLVRLRLIEFQDWHTPPPSSDDGMDFAGDDSDSRNSNYNGYHPGFNSGGGRRPRPKAVRFGGNDDPRLGPGYGPAFRAWETRHSIIVGELTCPILEPRGAMPCRSGVSAFQAEQSTRVDVAVEERFDFQLQRACSPSPVKLVALDPMLSEAALCTPRKGVSPSAEHAYSIDLCPLGRQVSRIPRRGLVGIALDADVELLAGRMTSLRCGTADGPECLFGGHFDFGSHADCDLSVRDTVVSCMSVPVECGSGPCIPGPLASPTFLGDGNLLSPWPASVAATEALVDSSPHRSDGAHVQAPSSSTDDFISSFVVPLPLPVLLSTPQPRKTKAERAGLLNDDDLIPKRSARLAAKSKYRAARPEAQARKVMMKKLGVEVETELPDEASFDEFQTAFKLPLSSSTREAMQVFFRGRKQRVPTTVRAA